MKSFERKFQKLPLMVATGLLLGGVSTASGLELWATNNLPQVGDSDEIITFDSANPATVTTLGNTNVVGAGFGGLDFDGNGNLYAYVSFNGTSGLYSIDQGTGNATAVGTLDGTPIADLAYNPTDGLMYGCGGGTLYTVNTGDGSVTAVGPFSGTDGLEVGMGIDAFGTIYVLDIVNDQITSGTTAQAPLVALPVDANFSQGIFINWSEAGASQTGYHGAIGSAPAFFSHLYSFPTDGTSYDFLGAFTPDGDFPTAETGDVTAAPAGGTCPPSKCPADLNGDNTVGVDDLLILLANWGSDGLGACIVQGEGEQVADVNDLLALLAAWGDCPEPPDVENDLCDEALSLGQITTTTVIMGSLENATFDGAGACDGVANDGVGVWYTVDGIGEQILLSMCHPDNADISFDARISVYCGTCNALQCVAASDDSGCAEGASLPDGLGFCAGEEATYYILVHMAAGGTPGDFALVLDTNGFQCQPDPQCLPVQGDFCDEPLQITSTLTDYSTLGANTDGPTYLDETCGNNANNDQTFNDIWYTYEVPCDGLTELTISTCTDVIVNGESGSANFDTDLVLYGPYASVDDIDCSGEALNASLYGCNDDDTNNDDGCGGTPAWQSTIRVPVSGGEIYLIRCGGWGDTDEGSGTLLVACADPADAACCTSGGCADTSQDDCANQGGQWNQGIECSSIGVGGSNFNCDSLVVGACCLPSGCSDLTGDECAAQNGIFFEGSDCGSFSCPTGACCVGGICTDGVNQADCNEQGGIWYDATACADVTCGADADYQYDNGTSETAVGAGGGDFAWAQRFNVIEGGNDTIDEIITQWGTPGGTSGVTAGDTAGWAIYQGDGSQNIANATLLAQGTVVVDGASIESDVQQSIAVTPTAVTGEFWIACWVTTTDGVGAFPSPVDTDTPQPPNTCFHAFGAGGSFDANDPSGFSELSVVTGVWVLRANGQ